MQVDQALIVVMRIEEVEQWSLPVSILVSFLFALFFAVGCGKKKKQRRIESEDSITENVDDDHLATDEPTKSNRMIEHPRNDTKSQKNEKIDSPPRKENLMQDHRDSRRAKSVDDLYQGSRGETSAKDTKHQVDQNQSQPLDASSKHRDPSDLFFNRNMEIPPNEESSRPNNGEEKPLESSNIWDEEREPETHLEETLSPATLTDEGRCESNRKHDPEGEKDGDYGSVTQPRLAKRFSEEDISQGMDEEEGTGASNEEKTKGSEKSSTKTSSSEETLNEEKEVGSEESSEVLNQFPGFTFEEKLKELEKTPKETQHEAGNVDACEDKTPDTPGNKEEKTNSDELRRKERKEKRRQEQNSAKSNERISDLVAAAAESPAPLQGKTRDRKARKTSRDQVRISTPQKSESSRRNGKKKEVVRSHGSKVGIARKFDTVESSEGKGKKSKRRVKGTQRQKKKKTSQSSRAQAKVPGKKEKSKRHFSEGHGSEAKSPEWKKKVGSTGTGKKDGKRSKGRSASRGRESALKSSGKKKS